MASQGRISQSEARSALSLLKGVTPEFVRRLSECGIAPDEAMRMRPAALAAAISCNPELIWTAEKRDAALERAREIHDICQAKHIEILHFHEEGYPRRLAECHDAPLTLYKIGPADLDAPRMLSMVGTRHATSLGDAFCSRFVGDLAAACPPVTIVSGLAFGIDAMAHQSALKASMPTIAVLAHGLNMIYPAQHRPLAEKIVRSGGALITEYPPGTKPFRGNFLARNRIVAALCDGLIVVESPVRSGSLSTASLAFGYDREVMAVPGRCSDSASEGCNLLIRRNKASLTMSAAQAMDTLGWKSEAETDENQARQLSIFDTLHGTELAVYRAISEEPHGLSIDMLVGRTGIRLTELSETLYNLEFTGAIIRLPNSRYTIP